MTSTPTYQRFVGIDIAAKTATVAVTAPQAPTTRPFLIEQTPAGIAALIQRLQAGGVPPSTSRVVLEATGSSWITLATALHHAGFAVSVINPAQAHAFATALLKRAKTDAIDAQTLAQLAALLQPAPWTPPPAVYYELQQRLAQRAALLDLRQQVRNQLHALLQHPGVIATVRARMETLIATLTTQILELEGELAGALAMDAAWAAAAERLQSIKGIGLLTAGWILVTTLNFSVCATAEEATAYAGLAPNEGRSGTSVWKRPQIGHTGNARLRTALYLATLNAAQTNPAIKTFYNRLLAAGKLKKVARCAAARKLLHGAWAVVTKEQLWDPNYQQQQQQQPSSVQIAA
jgi:transposase